MWSNAEHLRVAPSHPRATYGLPVSRRGDPIRHGLSCRPGDPFFSVRGRAGGVFRPGKNKGVDCNINVRYTRLDIQGISHPNAGQHPQQPSTEHGCSRSDGYLARLVSDTEPVTMTTLFKEAITFRHVSEFVSKKFSEFGFAILPQGINRRPSRENMVKTTRNTSGHLSFGCRFGATSGKLFGARSWRPPGSGTAPDLQRPLSKRPGSLREAPP